MQKIIVLHEPNAHRAEIESVGTVISEVRNDATKYYALLVDVPDQRVSLLSQICTCNEKHVKAIHDNYEVKAFFLDYPVSAELVDARQLLNAEPFWNQYGTKGAGVKVGIVDTGADWLKHPDLIGQVIAARSFVDGETETTDLNGHGTHVCGTIVGTGKASSGKYAGMAPDAKAIIAKGLSGSGSGTLFGIIQGYNWDVQQGAQVMSLSLGGGPASCPVDDALAQAFDAAAQNQGVVTCKASGNCLIGDSLILTNEGPIPLKNVKQGSLVYCNENNVLVLREVKRTIQSGSKIVFRVRTRNRTVIASSEHPFLSVRYLGYEKIRTSDGIKHRHRKYALSWTPLKELKRGDVLVSLVDNPCYVFKNRFSVDEMRFLGFYLADGWTRLRNGQYKSKSGKINIYTSLNGSVDLAVYDNEKIGCYAAIGEGLLKTKAHIHRGILSFYGVKPTQFIRTLGFGDSALTKVIPEWVWSSDKNTLRAFLDGYRDGDGSVGLYGKKPSLSWSFEAHNAKLIKQMRFLAILAGYRVSNISGRFRFFNGINKKGATYRSNSAAWAFKIFPRQKTKRNGRFLRPYHGVCVPKINNDLPNYLELQSIVDIKELGEREVYDMEVDSSYHNFVADGLVVHNSGLNSIDATVQAAQFSINCGAATKNKTIANFTSRRDADPNCSNPRPVPDVYGIGVNLIAARSKDATIGTPLPENPKYMALSGTCLTEDTMVGGYSIKDLLVGYPVPALYGIDTVLDKQNHGKQSVYQLTTKHGKTIDATANHKFLVKVPQKTVWTPLADLKIGDQLVVESTSNMGGVPCPAYDLVKRIEPVGEEEVYDITTVSHNFVANGIVVHNSMGTPCVAGVCALLLSKFGKIEPVTLRNALIKAGAKIGL